MSAAALTLVGTVVVALSGMAGVLGASWISKRASERANVQVAAIEERANARASAVAERVVDREDFDAVMTRMDRELDRSDKRMGELEGRLELEVTARAKAEERAIQAEERALQAEARAQRLERRVTQLEAILRAEGMTIPPPEIE